MQYPIITETYPINYSKNFPISGIISAKFSHDLDTSTINEYTVYLRKGEESTRINATLDYNRETTTIYITPSSFLEYDKIYSVTFVGDVDVNDGISVGIKDTDGNPMVSSYVLTFSTETLETTTDTEETEENTFDNLVVNTTELAHYIEVVTTLPENMEANVDLQSLDNSIFIYFNDDLDTYSVSSDVFGNAYFGGSYFGNISNILKDYLHIYRKPVLGGTKVTINPYDIRYLSYLRAIEIVLEPSDVLTNTEYVILLHSGLKGIKYSAMLQNYRFKFTSIYYPMFITADQILLEIEPALQDVPEDTIYRVIFENTLHMIKKGYISATISELPEPYLTYLLCKTKYDLLRAIMSGKVFNNGSKRLGDLEITVNLDARILGPLMDDFKNCYIMALREINKAIKTPLISKNDPSAPWQVNPYRGHRNDVWSKKIPYKQLLKYIRGKNG